MLKLGSFLNFYVFILKPRTPCRLDIVLSPYENQIFIPSFPIPLFPSCTWERYFPSKLWRYTDHIWYFCQINAKC
jgi:hypothetical protein